MKRVPPPVAAAPGSSDLPPQALLISGLDVRVEEPVAGVLVEVEGENRMGSPAAVSLVLSLPAALSLAGKIEDAVNEYLYEHDDIDDNDNEGSDP